jgi:alpha-glucosidase
MKDRMVLFFLAGSLAMLKPVAASFEIGEVRVQVLGRHLVRVEQRGPRGFEDRETFTIRGRMAEPATAVLLPDGLAACVETDTCRVVVPAGARGLAGVRIESPDGEPLCVLSKAALAPKFLPAPSALPAVWVLGDAPRVVPPAWGALPPPAGVDDPASGWDLENAAPDAYVFFPAASGYDTFRRDFLRLTGAVPLVPLYALGLWYSRYYPYDEESALAVIDRFRGAGIPLDVFVADTDWRVGASTGYAVNAALFPDMARFIRRAHERQVRIMLNDHPEPHGRGALDPAELRYRQAGLHALLAAGVDVWWFDRNWHTHLQAPVPGLDKEIWGMRLYHDITQAFHPGRRPLILSNADGIDNGRMDAPAHPAAHRFPVWWTGDTVAEWRALRLGVVNGVDSGIRTLLPYVHEDLGGHHGQPDPELYVRFMQFGAFAPVARIHCTTQVHRYPWAYGAEVERIVGDYVRLRYRLLPMLYAAAHAAHRTGTPLLRRCDLEWPGHAEAADATQYLLGDDLLVAPVLAPASGSAAERTVWIPPGAWQDLWSGRIHCGPAVIGVQAALHEMPVFVRRGGILITAPHRSSTGAAVWPEVVIEAFTPLQDGRAVRGLCEDDGWSTAYRQGAVADTELALARTGRELELMLQPRPAPAGIRPAQRTVIIRLHLPPGAGAGRVAVDGHPLGAGEYWMIGPAAGRAVHLFAGGGSLPPAEAGPVLEWQGEVDPAEPVTMRVELDG